MIDCHTHLVFAGNRAEEAEQRLQGVSYTDIAKAGGGILSSVRHTRDASEDELFAQSLPRLQALIADGVACVEIKSGYGLDLDNERKMLRVAKRLGEHTGITVKTTYLAAHALPPEFAGRSDDYIDAVCAWLPILHAEGLVDAVDVFCEGIGFSPAQSRRVFEAAQHLDLPVKCHADQLSDLSGAGLVAEFSGLSADHLEYTSDDSVRAMAAAGTVAVLLPGAFHVLRETKLPPLDAFRDARRADGGGHRLQPGHRAAALAAPGHGDGLHAFQTDSGRSAARRHRTRRQSAGPVGPWPVGYRAARRHRAVEHQASLGTLLLAGRQSA